MAYTFRRGRFVPEWSVFSLGVRSPAGYLQLNTLIAMLLSSLAPASTSSVSATISPTLCTDSHLGAVDLEGKCGLTSRELQPYCFHGHHR